MTNSVIYHYEAFLAKHYTWMFGVPFRVKVEEQRQLLENLGVAPGHHGMAIDLGSGSGFQSIALAELGFERILAIDASQSLLNELNTNKDDQPVETIVADLCDFDRFTSPDSTELIVCMGDTLTHLKTKEDVSNLFHKIRDALQIGGLFIITYRDLSIELTGLDRFLSIRGDTDRIMICMLEYEPGAVVVNDLVHVRCADGWTLFKNSYRKLRLCQTVITNELMSLGLTIKTSTSFGQMSVIVAERGKNLTQK